MNKTVLSPQAEADREQILTYLDAQAGYKKAEDYQQAFKINFRMLADYPESMPLRPHLGRNVRLSIIKPYNIFHRYDAATDTVTILRIIHSKRKITPKLIRE